MRHNQKNLKHHYRRIEAACTCKKRVRRSYVVNASNGESFDSKPQDASPKSFWASNKYSLYTFYKFSRPYVMIATVKSNFLILQIKKKKSLISLKDLLNLFEFVQAINIISVSILAVEKLSDISLTFFIGLFKVEI